MDLLPILEWMTLCCLCHTFR